MHLYLIFFFFFFNDTATTEIYTLSLHDALPILLREGKLDDRFIEIELTQAVMPMIEVLTPQGMEGMEFNRSEEHTSELQSPCNLVCRLLLEKKKNKRSDEVCMCDTRSKLCRLGH